MLYNLMRNFFYDQCVNLIMRDDDDDDDNINRMELTEIQKR